MAPTVVISTGCPAGIGPEVAVQAAARLKRVRCVLLGDQRTLELAAERSGVEPGQRWTGDPLALSAARRVPRMCLVQAGPELKARDRKPGRPTSASGAAQLSYLREAFSLARASGWPLATAPVSKEAIATSPEARCPDFRGHTEWLEAQDGAKYSVMCFASRRIVTSLVTTHIPLAAVPKALTAAKVERAITELAGLLLDLERERPRIAVCSLNPHAGEGELLGTEERRVVAPAIARARRRWGRRIELIGPVGAETAYRKAYGGEFDGVVAMYHDQATIPLKLVAFGEAVNVTRGLSIVRTSVDHGTAYDIAWRGTADASGMVSAIELAARLAPRSGGR